MQPPERPRNVVAHLVSGAAIKLALRFVRVDEKGMAIWRTTRPIDRNLLMNVTVERLPARTTIVVMLDGQPGDASYN